MVSYFAPAMKRNLKLILILIVAAGIGIIVVLSSWLYGSYHQRMELFQATAERAMFDAIQETIQRKEGTGSFARLLTEQQHNVSGKSNRLSPHFGKLVTQITEAYPEINPDSLAALLDSLTLPERRRRFIFHRATTFSAQTPSPAPVGERKKTLRFDPNERPRQLLPNFLFGQSSLDSTAIASITDAFKRGLENNGIHTDFIVNVITDDERGEALLPPYSQDSPVAGNVLSIRPLLIDPENGKFITVTFDRPWQYLLYNLSWQLIISVVLVATIIGCFIYLFHTIFKQNKLALLRKTFVNNMTHELRTPVATVSAAVQALQSYTDLGDWERRKKYLSISKEELDHLATMIDNVLHVAEGDQLTIKKLNCQNIDLALIIQRCVEKAQIHHQDNPITVVFDPPPEGATVYGDGEHLRNVVANLLDNAAKYGATKVHITLRFLKQQNKMEIQVGDNGIGIPKVYQDQIFEPFFRVPEGNLHRAKGNGLGLSYVKQVITQHNGTINVKSDPGKGSLFTLTVPKTGYDD